MAAALNQGERPVDPHKLVGVYKVGLAAHHNGGVRSGMSACSEAPAGLYWPPMATPSWPGLDGREAPLLGTLAASMTCWW